MSKHTPWKVVFHTEWAAETDQDGNDVDIPYEVRSIEDADGNTVVSDEYGIDKLTLERIVMAVNAYEANEDDAVESTDLSRFYGGPK